MNNKDMEAAYERYFAGMKGREPVTADNNKVPEIESPNRYIYGEDSAKRLHLIENSKMHDDWPDHHTVDGHIGDIEGLANILKQLCNAAWGNDWGQLSCDMLTGEDSSNIKLPQVVIDVNQRDVSEGIGTFKPILIDVQKEYNEDGTETGDAFLIYRQWFDQNIEFDIYGHNSKEAREIMTKLERLILSYTGYIKRKGVSEIFFLKEVSPRSALNYYENIPMRCVYYFVRTETIIPIRISLINKINVEIGAKPLTVEGVSKIIKEATSLNAKSEIEFDFFDGDNGITYEPS